MTRILLKLLQQQGHVVKTHHILTVHRQACPFSLSPARIERALIWALKMPLASEAYAATQHDAEPSSGEDRD